MRLCNSIFSFCPRRDTGFINNENGSDEYEAMQFATTQSNTESNVSITLKILNISNTISLFDQGKIFR